MNDRDIPLMAHLALEALKVQSAMARCYKAENRSEYYKALQGMAANEPWTSRIIRAAKENQAPHEHLDFSVLNDQWLMQLSSVSDSSSTEIEEPKAPNN